MRSSLSVVFQPRKCLPLVGVFWARCYVLVYYFSCVIVALLYSFFLFASWHHLFLIHATEGGHKAQELVLVQGAVAVCVEALDRRADFRLVGLLAHRLYELEQLVGAETTVLVLVVGRKELLQLGDLLVREIFVFL